MLKKSGCIQTRKEINGKINVVYLGIRSSYRPEVVNDQDDFVNDEN